MSEIVKGYIQTSDARICKQAKCPLFNPGNICDVKEWTEVFEGSAANTIRLQFTGQASGIPTDCPEGYKVPETRTDFSFFPDQTEADAIAEADTDTLVQYIIGNRNLEGAFLHELWRTNRASEMYGALSEIYGAQDFPFEEILNFTQKLTNTVANAYLTFKDKREFCWMFALETMGIAMRALTGASIEKSLTEEEKSHLSGVVEIMFSKIDTLKIPRQHL